MEKITKPTSALFPVTKVPNVATTPPASAFAKIERVVDTFNPNLNKVSNNKRDGKMENCNASVVFIATKMTMRANVIFMSIKILKSTGGIGITNMTMISITPTNTDKSLMAMHFSPYDYAFF
jgi:hypothetical protein